MPDFKVGQYEDLNKKKSGLISSLLTVILILLLFQPLFTDVDSPPEQLGIKVLIGSVDQKRGPIQEPIKQPEKVKKQKVVKKEEKKSSSKSRSKKTIVTDDPDAIRIKKEKKKREKAKKRKEEKEAREAAEAKRIAAAEKKREVEEAEKRAKALSFGTTNNEVKPGKEGNSILDGKNTGNAIGGGLGGRGVISAPKITDNSQDAGVVVVKVCVDRNGDVIQAEIRQTVTTTTSSRLKKIALEGARSYKFKKDLSAPKKQCGTITVDFKMK